MIEVTDSVSLCMAESNIRNNTDKSCRCKLNEFFEFKINSASCMPKQFCEKRMLEAEESCDFDL